VMHGIGKQKTLKGTRTDFPKGGVGNF